MNSSDKRADFKHKNKILAVSIGGLGDTILFSPLLKALRGRFPMSSIDLMVASPLAEQIYKPAGEVDHVIHVNLNNFSPFIKMARILPYALKFRLSGGYDLAVFATGLNPRLKWYLKTVAAIKQIYSAPEPPSYNTDLACNLKLARRFSPTVSEKDVFIPIPESGMAEAERRLREIDYSKDREHLIALYPSTDLPHRPRWQLNKMLNVAKAIKKDLMNVKFIVVGSKQEGLEWEDIDTDNFADANIAGTISLLETAAIISQCSFILGNDGGLMHLAGAVQCPMVVIMPNTPSTYRPPGDNTTVIKSNLTCCAGRYPDRPSWCHEADCATDISEEAVYEACLNILPNAV